MFSFIYLYLFLPFPGILAALASSSATMHIALQLAFCHLFFNISGIILFYPVPKMRKIIINTAKYLGRTTAHYRWFAIAYLICMFVLFPGFFFTLSLAGTTAFIVVLCIIFAIVIFVVVVTLMQRSRTFSNFLPAVLRTWVFLPEFMRSLAPLDRCLNSLVSTCFCCQCCKEKCSCLSPLSEEDMGSLDLDSDSDDSVEISRLSSVVSSKAHLALTKSPSQPSFTESRRIYRPVNDMSASPSRRSSVGKRSPPARRVNYTDGGAEADLSDLPLVTSAEPSPPNSAQKYSTGNGSLKPSFYFTNSDDHCLNHSSYDKESDVRVIDVAATNLDSINESKI